MFRKLLIANRGEIACRVMRTARRMGLRTVAVYSEADAHAQHVLAADEAVCIGPAAAQESYLAIGKIIAAAKRAGAEAVHPGYGFLSENEDFAQACADAGLAFVGPPPAAIRAMGSKSAAKSLMEKAGVPLVPGYHGDDQSAKLLAKEADRIGYPVLIKASAGGGGKGMRIVERAADFDSALAACKREALSSFGDDRVLIERCLAKPRHVEIQVFADARGNCVHLFERDCSVQRRHQKVIEEAPAPGMTSERRARMGEAAVAAAKAVGYVGAGTVEFIVDTLAADAFYFMEMNTRLQVEHPVTEMITGEDLVEWQLRIAAGEPLPRKQDELRISGHAIEARLYAEDPARGFLPAVGRIAYLRLPRESAHIRVDSGVAEGDAISPHYDPMIAKLVVWDRDRSRALARMSAALDGVRIVGLATNVEFLGRVVGSRAFASADLDTGLIERSRAELFPEAKPVDETTLAVAAFVELTRHEREAKEHAAQSGDPHSPWGYTDGWRLNQDNHHVLVFRAGEQEYAVTVHYRRDGYEIDLPSGRRRMAGRIEGDRVQIWLDDRAIGADVVRNGESIEIFGGAGRASFELHDPWLAEVEGEAQSGGLSAPMPGKVVAVLVQPGARVERGAPLLILEAMKMEHSITAPAAGVVKAIHYKVGEQVGDGVELLAFEAEGI